VAEPGAIFYRGPSLLTGAPIVAVAVGLEGGSLNRKTGPMVQVYVLRSDLGPMDAKRRNLDDAVCGDCKLRGHEGIESACYVTVWNAPRIVYEHLDGYIDADWSEIRALVEGRHVRCAAYGDPAAVPFEVWRQLLSIAAGWTMYTHQWRTCDPRFKTLAMASVDDLDEFRAARLTGWRTFRVRGERDPIVRGAEVTCPASDEAGHRTTCARCSLCRGTARPARSIVIAAHGKPSNLIAFYSSRTAAEATA
jgi:hypothetical protein